MRDYAQIRINIWNDDDFCDLTPDAQLLYFVLISHPSLNRAGVGTWHAGRLSNLNATWDKHRVNLAAVELIDAYFIVIDEETDEFLVRTFVRHDGLMKQRNMATTMAREFAGVGSRRIKSLIVFQLQKLHKEFPGWKGWESAEAVGLLSKRAIDPTVSPKVYPSFDLSVDPKVNPSVKGQVNPSIDPTVKGEPNPSVDPSIDPSPTPAPTPAPLQEGGNVGGDGGPGDGEEETGNESNRSESNDPPFQNLDELAARFAGEQTQKQRGICPRHPNGNPTGEPCRMCGEAKAERAEDAQAKKQARRAAIDECDLCDDNGMRITSGGAKRCNHQTPPF